MNNMMNLWLKPSRNLKLLNHEVHVWRIPIDIDTSIVKTVLSILSFDEEEKASRFYFDKDRARFIIVRAILRIILGYYLDKEPKKLEFKYNQYGKPELRSNNIGDSINFNVSHSQEIALIAVTKNRKIGVDVEYIRTICKCDEIVSRFFSETEKAIWCSLPDVNKAEAFFNCWTRKEAYVKAKGQGLSFPLNKFDVSFKLGEPVALLNTTWDEQEASYWSIQEIIPAPGYVGALVVEKGDLYLRLLHWSNRPVKKINSWKDRISNLIFLD